MNIKGLHEQQFNLARNANEIAGLDSLRQAANSGDKAALETAAEEFEAIFVRMMLKSMRQASEALADENNPMNSHQVKFFRDMHDQQLASDLAAGDGLGLATLIVQQLGPQQEGYTPASVIRTDGNLPTALTSKAHKSAGFEDKESFVKALMPAIEPVANSLGVDPKGLLAQAALETGWGQHMIHAADGRNSNNFFGIKASKGWQGEQASVQTVEYHDGIAKRESAAFRVYESVKEGLNDYVEFLHQDRYAEALKQPHDTKGFFQALQHAGYATDPQYADKIMSIVKRLVD